MINLITVACIGVPVISSGACIGTAIWKQKKLDEAMKMLEGKVEINVDDHYVKHVIDQTIKNNVNSKIDDACNTAVYKVKSDIYAEVQKSVKAQYADLKASVKKEMERQVGKIDIDDIRSEVIEEAKEKAAEKFDNDLEKVLEKYNENLDNVNKIYENIAKTLAGANEKKSATTLTIA